MGKNTKKKTPKQKFVEHVRSLGLPANEKESYAVLKARVAKKEPVFKIKRIRMLRSCANQDMAYIKGHSYKVPEQVSIKTARSWLASETAEEDKSLAGVPEEKK